MRAYMWTCVVIFWAGAFSNARNAAKNRSGLEAVVAVFNALLGSVGISLLLQR